MHAQTVPGVTCSVQNGVYVCTDGSGGSTGTVCVTSETGQQACTNVGGSSGGSTFSLGTGLGATHSRPNVAASSGWLSKLTGWFAYAISSIVQAIFSFLKDLVTYVIAVVLSLVTAAINAIKVPDWLSQYSLSNLLGQTGTVAGYFMSELNIGVGLGLIGAGYAFRLLRKFVTLFQW